MKLKLDSSVEIFSQNSICLMSSNFTFSQSDFSRVKENESDASDEYDDLANGKEYFEVSEL